MHLTTSFVTFLSLLTPLISAAPFLPRDAITPEEIADRSAQGDRLIKLGRDEEPVWVTGDEKLGIMREGKKFVDVTVSYTRDQATLSKTSSSKSAAKAEVEKADFPSPSKQDTVNPLLEKLSVDNMKKNLDHLTKYNNRFYDSDTGKEASDWIKDTVQGIASDEYNVTQFTHSFAQSSVIATIPGDGPLVILGAHMDSINHNDEKGGRAPGADDDGTGTVNLIEVWRVLVESGFEPKGKQVEFHWYAGEEGGLLGSEDVASKYKSEGKEVEAFMELDMTGYFKPGSKEVFALQADYIDESLNDFLKKLIDEYARFGWAMDKPCGYACSDHASWHDRDYPASFPYEAVTGEDDPEVHGEGDTVDVEGFSWDHSIEFAKLAIAYVVELAG